MPLLDATAAAVKGNPQVTVVEVKGHADARGSEDYNADLTERRASAVSEALEERGVASSRIESAGFGATQPICSTDDEDCWSQNRRVDILPAPGRRTRRADRTTQGPRLKEERVGPNPNPFLDSQWLAIGRGSSVRCALSEVAGPCQPSSGTAICAHAVEDSLAGVLARIFAVASNDCRL